MENKYSVSLVPDFGHTYLYDNAAVYKTDVFVKETSYADKIDDIVSKIGETIIRNISQFDKNNTYEVEIGYNVFKFVLKNNDVIFYDYQGSEIHIADKRFVALSKEQYILNIRKIRDKEISLKKLYALSFDVNVNIPRLNLEQNQIVTMADGNILVQGVAGSGKTNVCIDRIVYAACMGYKGHILYSTYSRGLLIETKNKINAFIKRIQNFKKEYDNNLIIIKGDKIKAISNYLGIWLAISDEKSIASSLNEILAFLTQNVDYMLIQDIYNAVYAKTVQIADEDFFIKKYIANIKNHQLAANLEKIKTLSYEIIYKEIFGMISGSEKVLSEDEYIKKREASFSRFEAQTIYAISQDYFRYMDACNAMDNNTMSHELLGNKSVKNKYFSIILDEVQDFTQINLQLFSHLGHRLFCVGDALQMINPSYFSFAYLKRMMFEEDITDVKELKHNYRNTAKLEEIIENLNKINIERFGTHSFVLDGQSIDTDVPTKALYSNGQVLNDLKSIDLKNATFVVASTQKKIEVHEKYPKAEVLTVSDIKGMERDTIILLDILSDNSEKWDKLYRDKVNKKQADENSSYRYWFNLMYVGISRAKRNLFVIERKDIPLFSSFINENFDKPNVATFIKELSTTLGKGKLDDNEILIRIDQFLNQGQYDNARFASENLSTLEETNTQLKRIDIYEQEVKAGKYMDAGIRLWENGLNSEAKEFFALANAPELSDLVDAIAEGNEKLDANIIKYYPKLENNEVARKLILDTISKDITSFKQEQKNIDNQIRKLNARRK